MKCIDSLDVVWTLTHHEDATLLCQSNEGIEMSLDSLQEGPTGD